MMIGALVFDLDDTLYVESDFVASGYRAVARHLAAGRGQREREILHAMMFTFAARGRDHVFSMALERFAFAGATLCELVDIYRNHEPCIRLLPGYRELLRRLRRNYRLGIITDGLPEVQRRKVRALKLGHMVDKIIYSWDLGADKEKPHPLPFMCMLGHLGVDPSRALFVGDNPAKDGEGARRVGMRFVQVGIPMKEAVAANGSCRVPEGGIRSLLQLPSMLR